MAKGRGSTTCKTCWVLTKSVYIALGSNLGDSIDNIKNAFGELQALSATPVISSSLWRSMPVDCPPDSPDFINAAVGLNPLQGETPESLLSKLQGLELKFGRKPKVFLNEPRPIDLDMIAFGSEVRDLEQLILPHPRCHQRRFVLEPLNEIAPDYILPNQTVSVSELLKALQSDECLMRL